MGRLANYQSRRRELCLDERWVVNLTDRTLTPAQEDVLNLGLNFAPAPSKLPLTDTTATVGSGARKLTPEDADDLWGYVCGILRCVKVPRNNLTKDQRTALKELRGLNSTSRQGECDHDDEEMLGTGTYGKLRGPYSCPGEQAES